MSRYGSDLSANEPDLASEPRSVTELSLALALQDLLSVAVSAVGWWFVVWIVRRQDPQAGRSAAVGAVLVVAGGLPRATWLITALMDAGSGRAVPVLWFGVATAGSIIVAILLAWRAHRAGRDLVALMFILGIAATLLLNGLARLPDRSEPIQWAAQAANTLNQLVFTLAAWRRWIAERTRALDGERSDRPRSLLTPGAQVSVGRVLASEPSISRASSAAAKPSRSSTPT